MNTRPNPYVGPRPFTAGETLPARQHEVLGLRRALISARILVFHSQSGAGKTSLLEAKNGLRRAMADRGFLVHRTARVHQAPPARFPIPINRYELSVMRTLAVDTELDLTHKTKFGLASYLDGLREYLPDNLDPEDSIAPYPIDLSLKRQRRRELLIFDQFEEILTTDPSDEAGRRQFFEHLAQVLEDPYRWALFVMREDYLGALEPWAERLPTQLTNHFRIDLLRASGARDAIRGPAAAQGVVFDEDALDHLVGELRRVNAQGLDGRMETRDGLWVEPVQLQVVCHRLWSRLEPDETRVTLAQVQAQGDVDIALGGFYGEQVAAIAASTGTSERQLRDWIGSRLISPQGIRTPVTRSADGMDVILEALEAMHLVRGEERHGIKWYELAHDRLVAPIRANNEAWEWENLHPIQLQAVLWERRGEPRELMLSDEALANGDTWVAGNLRELTAKERTFVQRSRENAAERARERQVARELAAAQMQRLAEQERRVRQLSILGLLLGVAFVAAAVLGAIAYRRWGEARRQAAAAEDSADQASLEAIRAAEEGQTTPPAPDAALRSPDDDRIVASRAAAGDPVTQATLLREVERVDEVRGWLQAAVDVADEVLPIDVLRGSWDRVAAVAVAPDGVRVLTVAADTMQVWRFGEDVPVSLPNSPGGAIRWATFAPDRSQVLAVTEDGVARLWRVDGGGPVALGGHLEDVTLAVFSRDGARVLTASRDGRARVWSVRDPRESVELVGPQRPIEAAEFSPDGARVLTRSTDGTARIWQANGEGAPVVWPRAGAAIMSASFSLDGVHVLTTSSDRTPRIWRADGAGEGVALGKGDADLRAVYALDPARVLVTTGDGGARIVHVRGAVRPVPLAGHTQPITGAEASADGRYIVTASLDRTVRIWRADGTFAGVLHPGSDPSIAARFTVDAAEIVTWTRESVQIWRRDASARNSVLREHAAAIRSAAFTASGADLLTVSDAGVARVWGARSPEITRELVGFLPSRTQAALSPDGTRVVAASPGGAARMWRIDGGEPVVFSGHGAEVTSASFSSDGSRVLTTAKDGSAWVWRADGAPIATLRRSQRRSIRWAMFSPTGAQVLVGQGPEVAVWPVDGGVPVVLTTQGGDVASAAVSPDGALVVITSESGATWLRRTDGTGEPAALLGAAAAFSRDGAQILTIQGDRALVWQTRRPSEPTPLSGHKDAITAAMFSPKGGQILTASVDGTAMLWSIDGSTPPVVLVGHEQAVDGAVFSARGTQLLTWSRDGTARVWAADGTGGSLVLAAGAGAVTSAGFSRDAHRVVTVASDGSAKMWLIDAHDLAEDMWQRTRYCLSAAERVVRLHETSDAAAAGREACTKKAAAYVGRSSGH